MTTQPDLIQMLATDFLKLLNNHDGQVHTPPQLTAIENTIQQFVAYSRRQLAANPPVGVDYSIYGISLRFADSSSVPLVVDQPMVPLTFMEGPAISITQPRETNKPGDRVEVWYDQPIGTHGKIKNWIE